MKQLIGYGSWLVGASVLCVSCANEASENPGTTGGSSGAEGGENSGQGGSGSDDGEVKPPEGQADRLDAIVPLYAESTELEPEILFDRGDAVVTKYADRARDRHAREDEFQSYDHYLSHYWVHRTASFIFTDKVAKGGSTIDISFVTEWELDVLPEFRAWYYGMGTVAHYNGNYAPRLKKEGPGLYDNEHGLVGEGDQYKYTYTIDSAITLQGDFEPLAIGQFMEVEVSQFLSAPPEGRDNYYGTTFLYEVGHGGMVPWYTVGSFDDKDSERENSHKIPEDFWLGGRTTLPYQYSDEPDDHFMQMATNLSSVNGQPFVRGRRIHHTSMIDGSHDESEDNGIFEDLASLTGSHYINSSCDSCHKKNGRAPVAELGEALDKWVFKLGDDPARGSVLQPKSRESEGEGTVAIARWEEDGDGLRSPVYAFSSGEPEFYSARLAPQLVGVGLLEAVAESTILGFEDERDADGDGISGKAQIVLDPISGEPRLGRFGWKAAASSLKHQVAAALNTDMGVMTSVFSTPDCGSAQAGCSGEIAVSLADEHLDDLVKYVSLLGVRARRGMNDQEALRGQEVFNEVGCADCHATSMRTSKFHPFAELRDQLIHPYSDLLLHDMGPGLADNWGEADASGAEWRTTPLWGVGLSACVTGGVAGPFQEQVCTPHASYLHDGRARTLEEAILWHGGEGESAKEAFRASTEADRTALIKFLESL